MSDDWITTQEAIELSGYHPIYMRVLLREKKVKGKKFGRTWQVNKRSLLEYIENAQNSTDNRYGAKEE